MTDQTKDEKLMQVAQKALKDDDFRLNLMDNPHEAAKSIGVTLDPEQTEKIKSAVKEMKNKPGVAPTAVFVKEIGIFG